MKMGAVDSILDKIKEREFDELLERQTWRMSGYRVSDEVSDVTVMQLTLSIPDVYVTQLASQGEITEEQAKAIIGYQGYLRKKLINDLIIDMKALNILKEE